jgi:hypothetical protein
MPLDKSTADDFLPDDAKTPQERRDLLLQRLQLNWANEDIQEVERVTKHGQEGWAMWSRKAGDSPRQL